MRLPGIFAAGLLLLAACRQVEPEPPKPVLSVEGTVDSGIPINAVYKDLIRHTHRMRPGTVTHVSVSPDGKRFAYSSTEFRGRPQIYVQGSEAVVAAQMTGNNSNNLFPRISPDGRFIAYASDRFGNWDIFVARVDSPASVSQVTFDETDDIAPSWSPEGKSIVFCSRNRQGVWMLVTVDWQTGIPTVLGPGMYPDWGKRDLIAFQTQPGLNDARVGINLVQPDGRGLRQVNFDRFGKYSAVMPRWSPDGNWVVFGVVDGNPVEMRFGREGRSKDLWAVQHDGRNPMPLTSDTLDHEWWPSWGGDRIFFVSSRDDGFENVYSFAPRLIELEERGSE